MGYWKFIKPEATTNLLVDTSFALADPDTEWTFAGDGAEDFTRETARSFFGFSCAQADLGGGTYADIYQTVTTTATSYTLSCYVRRTGGGIPTASHTQAYFDDGNQSWDSITGVGNNWYYCVYTATATAAANGFGVRAIEDDLYIDAVQLENKAYPTTYCEGRQEGCAWNGAEDTSTSTRSAQSRAGGRVRDFEDDYSFEVVDWQGWGVPPYLLNLDVYAIQPGAQVNSIKAEVNPLTLTGYFQGTSLSNLHSLRQALVEELAHDRYPQTAGGWQPVRIRYTGSSVWKEAKCFYDSGLEGQSMVKNAYTELVPMRLLMIDPFWYEIGESAAVLDTNDTATMRYVAGRLRSSGQWDDLGLSANPTTGTVFWCVAYNPHDGRVYVGGNFTGMDGVAGRDYIAAYDPNTDSWSTVGAGSAVNAWVYDIAIAANGDVYICGDFTNVGDANGDYLAYYDISAGSWSSVAAQAGGSITVVRSLAFDRTGVLYVVGQFTNWNGIAAADHIFSWDGSSYAAVGTGITVSVAGAEDVVVGFDNTVYITGSFTEVGGTTAYYVAQWDGSSWSALGNGFSGAGRKLAIHPATGELYAAGGFTTNQAATATYNRIAKWMGTEWEPLGDGLADGIVYALAVSDDGVVYVGGTFTEAGGITLAEGIARWNGDAWAHLDVDLPGSPFNVFDIKACRTDPTIQQNYDLYICFSTTGTGSFAGTATATNDGTAPAYPVMVIERAGGTSARLEGLRNETTGREILYDYGLLNGETLTVDTRPGEKMVVSSMFKTRPDAVLANSDFGGFVLQPDTNQVTSFVSVVGGPAITAYLWWKDTYRGMD